MKNNQQVTVISKSISCAFILSMVFMVLKFCHIIDWSWWFVFLPMLIEAGIGILCSILFGIVLLIAGIADARG